MATATVARPANMLRRRDAPRTTLSKRATTMDVGEQAPNKRRKLEEPYVRDSRYVLKKHKGKPPSLIIHLHPAYFRFNSQEGSFAYNSPMRFVLEHLRRQTVPHQMLEELLQNNVPFYDGCLIVEVHNHRAVAGKDRGKHDSDPSEDAIKFSMHNYNEHITPSPLVPFPAKAKAEEALERIEGANGGAPGLERPDKEKEKDGPKISTIVLHPTPLTRHHELLILANTPASEVRSKKKSSDSTTPSSAQPPTPQLSVPPTPISTRGPLSQSQKMCLEERDFYAFQADMLNATEPPLYLEPVSNPQDAEKVLDMLAHPLHQDMPPSPKTRKRTTAEMAADDAQAAEAERRMLIMDERIKPSARAGTAAAANENQTAAASLGFSRFKTLEMVRQKHDEQERIKKDEEARAALEKKQAEEQQAAQAAQHQQQQMAKQQQMELMRQRQQAQRQHNLLVAQRQQEQARQQQIAEAQRAAQAAMAREHGHPHQNQMMQNTQQNSFQHPASMPQSSPVIRQQTPLMNNSSPMLPNGGFPMAQTSSQGAGSPQRPTSAAMHNRNVAMARQASQQHSSQNNTPNIPQGTPSMAQAIPNRQMTQTPRMGPGSPAAAMQGTPTSAAGMPLQTPQMGGNQLSQQMMLAMQQQNQGQQMSAQDISDIRSRQQQQQQNLIAQQHAMVARAQQQQPNNPQLQHVMRQKIMQQRAQMQQQQQQQMQQAMQMGQAGSPGSMHGASTPQMGHAHPQTPGHNQQHQPGVPGNASQEQIMEAQRRAMQVQAQRHAQHQLQQVGQQYGGWQNIPPNVIQTLPQNAQLLLRQQMHMQATRRHMAAQQAQRNMSPNAQVVPGGQANPEYMNQLRQNQAEMLARIHQQPGNQQLGAAGGFPGGIAMNMNMGNFGGNPGGGGQDSLSQHIAQMHNALNRGQGGGQQGNGGMQ